MYLNLSNAFDNPAFVAVYVLAALALGLHLHHAVWSVTQTLGWDKPSRNPTIRRLAATISLVVAVGFAAVPVAFWTGAMDEPAGGAEVSP